MPIGNTRICIAATNSWSFPVSRRVVTNWSVTRTKREREREREREIERGRLKRKRKSALFWNQSNIPTASLDLHVACGFTANFDGGMNNFTQNYLDKFDWTRKQGGTLSSSTGPSSDHTTGNGEQKKKKARLLDFVEQSLQLDFTSEPSTNLTHVIE